MKMLLGPSFHWQGLQCCQMILKVIRTPITLTECISSVPLIKWMSVTFLLVMLCDRIDYWKILEWCFLILLKISFFTQSLCGLMAAKSLTFFLFHFGSSLGYSISTGWIITRIQIEITLKNYCWLWFIVKLPSFVSWYEKFRWLMIETYSAYRNLTLHMVQLGTALWELALAPMLHILLVAFCTFPLIRFISFSSRQLLNHWTIDKFHNYEPCFLGKMYFKILNRLICKINSNI